MKHDNVDAISKLINDINRTFQMSEKLSQVIEESIQAKKTFERQFSSLNINALLEDKLSIPKKILLVDPNLLLDAIKLPEHLKNLVTGDLNELRSKLLPDKMMDELILSNEFYELLGTDPLLRTDHSWLDIVNAEPNKNNISSSLIITEANRVKKIIHKIYQDNSILFKLEPRKFEEVIAELLYSQGFVVELTKQTRDNGYDILALNVANGFPIKFLVECKRFTRQKVGIDIIRSFSNVINTEQANKGIIVTTSYFTLDAIKKQRQTPYLLEFRDRDSVLQWIEDYSLPKNR